MKNLFLILTLMLFCTLTQAKMLDAEVIPLNAGEAILLDSESSYRLWDMSGDKNSARCGGFYLYGDKNKKVKCTAKVEFKNIDCSGFDQLAAEMFSSGSEPIKVLVKVYTDAGLRQASTSELKDGGHDTTGIIVDIKGAKKIKSVVVECEKVNVNGTGIQVGLPKLYLRNSREMLAWIKHWDRFSKLKWKGLIRENCQPGYKPLYGLMFNYRALRDYRKANADYIKRNIAKYKNFPAPEAAISPRNRQGMTTRDYVKKRYLKAGFKPGANATHFFRNGVDLAFFALAARDKELMHLAARYTLSAAAVGEWSDNPSAYTMAYGMRMSAFEEGNCGFYTALMLDCAGEMLTLRGRSYVLKMLCFKAIAPISFSMWSRSRVNFNSNQGAMFLKAKVAALLMTERTFPYVSDYSDITLKELNIMMSNQFKADGSFMESVGYFGGTVNHAIPSYAMFANMRKKPLAAIIPPNIGNSGKYAQIISSTCKKPGREIISIGRGFSWSVCGVSNRMAYAVLFMAAANPDSMWTNLYQKIKPQVFKSLGSSTYQASGPLVYTLWNMAKKGKKVTPDAFVSLPDCGLVSSLREYDGEKVKIVVIGSATGVGKRKQDEGNFVLEYAGDAFAMYMPCVDSSFEDSPYHNMLNVLDKNNEIRYALKRLTTCFDKRMDYLRPEAGGNAKSFRAKVTLTKRCNPKYMKNWTRTIDSPTPDILKVTDSYMTGAASKGIALVWVTYLPAAIKDGKVIITGNYGGVAEITIPAGFTARIEKFIPSGGRYSNLTTNKGMNLSADYKSTRIIFSKAARANQQETVSLICKLKKAAEK